MEPEKNIIAFSFFPRVNKGHFMILTRKLIQLFYVKIHDRPYIAMNLPNNTKINTKIIKLILIESPAIETEVKPK